MNYPKCLKCNGEYVYEDGALYICPECGYEWPKNEVSKNEETFIVKDVNGNILKDGDSVVVIKDLKVKGASSPIKAGTKIKNIKLVDSDHNIDCKIPGFGKISLKSQFVKKA